MTTVGWQWDPLLYAGSAPYYAVGRVAYSDALIDRLTDLLGLDDRSRLVDVGCGPGSLTIPLAQRCDHATGLDADPEMLAEARRRAVAAGVGNLTWLHLRAEEITPAVGHFDVATLAQSFHWMDRPRVAALVHGVLTSGGLLAHVHATTHAAVETDLALPWPRPPRASIDEVVRELLGRDDRAGRGVREAPQSEGRRGEIEAAAYGAAGFELVTRAEVPGQVVVRTTDEVVASVFSLSYAAPHLFGARVGEFEQRLRSLLAEVGPEGRFSEQMRETAVDLWRA